MTVPEAIEIVRRVGTIQSADGKLKIRVPRTVYTEVAMAIKTLRHRKTEALSTFGQPDSMCPSDACRVLNATGVRIMDLATGPTIGIWSDLDGPEIRAALPHSASTNCPCGISMERAFPSGI